MRRSASSPFRSGPELSLHICKASASEICRLNPAVSAAGEEARNFSSGSAAALSPVHIEDEPFCRQRNIVTLGNRYPVLSPDVWIAPNAVIVGDVDLYDRVSPFSSGIDSEYSIIQRVYLYPLHFRDNKPILLFVLYTKLPETDEKCGSCEVWDI